MGKGYTNNNFQSPPDDLIEGYYDGLSKVWLPVLSLNELDEGAAKPVTLLGREVLMTKLDGNITAMPNYCSHFQERLSDGTVEMDKGDSTTICAVPVLTLNT